MCIRAANRSLEEAVVDILYIKVHVSMLVMEYTERDMAEIWVPVQQRSRSQFRRC